MEEMFGCSAMSDVVWKVMTSGGGGGLMSSQTELVVRYCYKANMALRIAWGAANWRTLFMVEKGNGLQRSWVKMDLMLFKFFVAV